MFGHWNWIAGIITFALIWVVIHLLGNRREDRAQMDYISRAPMEMLEAVGAASVIAFLGCIIYAAYHISFL